MIVKSKVISVIGLILGKNFCSNHSLPFKLMKITLLKIPSKKGKPR